MRRMAMLLLCTGWAGAYGATISEFGGNSLPQLGIYRYGQMVTTPATGGPWRNIQFCFGCGTQGVDLVPGELFLLSQEYLGQPSGLPFAPGLLASTSRTAGFGWVFDSAVSLLPGTTYYFYGTGTWQSLLHGPGDPTGPFLGYITNIFPDLNSPFQRTASMNYRLEGDPVPEPAAMGMAAVGLVLLRAGCWRSGARIPSLTGKG